jgi:hypothetical protein
LQENTAHPREILQMKINDTAEKSNRFNAKGIVHGRLNGFAFLVGVRRKPYWRQFYAHTPKRG